MIFRLIPRSAPAGCRRSIHLPLPRHSRLQGHFFFLPCHDNNLPGESSSHRPQTHLSCIGSDQTSNSLDPMGYGNNGMSSLSPSSLWKLESGVMTIRKSHKSYPLSRRANLPIRALTSHFDRHKHHREMTRDSASLEPVPYASPLSFVVVTASDIGTFEGSRHSASQDHLLPPKTQDRCSSRWPNCVEVIGGLLRVGRSRMLQCLRHPSPTCPTCPMCNLSVGAKATPTAISICGSFTFTVSFYADRDEGIQVLVSRFLVTSEFIWSSQFRIRAISMIIGIIFPTSCTQQTV
jgi:hypothetical protein